MALKLHAWWMNDIEEMCSVQAHNPYTLCQATLTVHDTQCLTEYVPAEHDNNYVFANVLLVMQLGKWMKAM